MWLSDKHCVLTFYTCCHIRQNFHPYKLNDLLYVNAPSCLHICVGIWVVWKAYLWGIMLQGTDRFQILLFILQINTLEWDYRIRWWFYLLTLTAGDGTQSSVCARQAQSYFPRSVLIWEASVLSPTATAPLCILATAGLPHQTKASLTAGRGPPAQAVMCISAMIGDAEGF